MVELSVSVMAHPARRGQVDRLTAALGDEIPVAWDSGKPSTGPEKRWLNGVRAWKLHDPDADWHLVLQDDALPCDDLLPALAKALEHVPGPGPVSLYMGTKRPSPSRVKKMANRADEEGASWIALPFLGWGVGIAVPVGQIDDMLGVAGVMRRLPYDTRIGKFFRDHVRVPTWYTWPSLLNHDQGPSLVGHGGSGRVAFRHLKGSALAVDWSSGHVVDDHAKRLVTQ